MVSNGLKGSIDYRIATENSIAIVEAKQADLTHGFVQLAAELIALDLWIGVERPHLYGAVTTGEDWRYRVPENVKQLLRILIAVSQAR